jgi:hypothetical protein
MRIPATGGRDEIGEDCLIEFLIDNVLCPFVFLSKAVAGIAALDTGHARVFCL